MPEGLFWGKGKEQDRVSCETSCSKAARAHVRRKLPCACSFSEAGAAAALPCWDRRCPLRGSAFSPVRGFDLPCTGVSLPLYGQDNFPFMGVEGKQTNERVGDGPRETIVRIGRDPRNVRFVGVSRRFGFRRPARAYLCCNQKPSRCLNHQP